MKDVILTEEINLKQPLSIPALTQEQLEEKMLEGENSLLAVENRLFRLAEMMGAELIDRKTKNSSESKKEVVSQ